MYLVMGNDEVIEQFKEYEAAQEAARDLSLCSFLQQTKVLEAPSYRLVGIWTHGIRLPHHEKLHGTPSSGQSAQPCCEP